MVSVSGKSFIFSSIIEKIKSDISEAQVIYYYCSYNDPSKKSFSNITKCFLSQLLALNPTCSQYLYDNLIGIFNPHSSSTNTLWKSLLENLALHHEQLFIGIDGLDECEGSERKQLLSTIHGINNAAGHSKNVRIFLTSRKEKDIRDMLSSATTLDIRPHHIEKDIAYYVRGRVSELGKKFELSEEHQRSITVDIKSRPRGRSSKFDTNFKLIMACNVGMFLLARLIMDNLLDQDCHEDLIEELKQERLPNGIEQA